MSLHPAIPDELAVHLRQARRVVAFTGAGISAESGVPTFRDAQTGLWARFRPEDLATPEAFRRHPQRVWEWYALRRERARSVQPNPGHFALAELERRVPDFTLVTQNVVSGRGTGASWPLGGFDCVGAGGEGPRIRWSGRPAAATVGR